MNIARQSRTDFLIFYSIFITLLYPVVCQVKDRYYWYEMAQVELNKRLNQSGASIHPYAKNIILLVGDGMSVATVTAARIMRGQREGKSGEEHELAWDRFPAVALARTYNLNAQVGESSACATALLCGVKTNYETLGVDAHALFEECHTSLFSKVPSLVDWAQRQGKSTGIVTTTRVTHATPAALYAHSPSRFWEDDEKMPVKARRLCKDIAKQLVENEPGFNLTVVLGGGRRHFIPVVQFDVENASEGGKRLDGRNLIDHWLRTKKGDGYNAEYVWNKKQLFDVDVNSIDHLLGLFSSSHMDFESERVKTPEGDPSITEMTEVALKILKKNPLGFFLMIEGGRIDHGHHYNSPFRALDETLAFEEALRKALTMVDEEDTLIVLTSDHSHVMTFGGQKVPKGNPVFGMDSEYSDIDGVPYTTILYGNGPGFKNPRVYPQNLTKEKYYKNVLFSSAAPRLWSTHGGEDVAVYAKGPLASVLFTGCFDQSYIAHAIAYAACLGQYNRRCREPQNLSGDPDCSSEYARKVLSTYGSGILASSVLSDDRKSEDTGKSYAGEFRPQFFVQILVIVSFSFVLTRM